MRPEAPQDPAWAARVQAAGVPPELFDGLGDDSEYFALQRAILLAARDALLSDEDVHPLLVRIWSGYWPAVDWPPDAPALTRRCAAILASQQKCEFDRRIDFPTDDSMKAVRDVIIAELALTPTDLLAVLADHWPQLRVLEMPDEGGCSLLSFAEDVLLRPLISACVQIWIVVDQPPPQTPPAPVPGRPDAWTSWTGPQLDGEWRPVFGDELARQGHPVDHVPDDCEVADELLASARAARLNEHGDTTLIADSIVRICGWPDDTTLLTPIVRKAIQLALDRVLASHDDTDEQQLVDAIQRDLIPPDDTILSWIRDPSVGRYEDDAGLARTGAEMIERAIDGITWDVAQDAYLVARATHRRPSANG